MYKPLYVGISGLVVLGLFAGYLYVSESKKMPAPISQEVANGTVNQIPVAAIVITLTKDGFVPDTVTIKKGDAITFKSTIGSLYWPASNLHPSHLLYAEFDPQLPLQPNDTWSFVFDQAGEWKFHDHLAPYFTGVITVTE